MKLLEEPSRNPLCGGTFPVEGRQRIEIPVVETRGQAEQGPAQRHEIVAHSFRAKLRRAHQRLDHPAMTMAFLRRPLVREEVVRCVESRLGTQKIF